MADQSPALDYPSRINYIAKSGKPDMWVHPLAAATRGLEGRELAEIALMKEAGARGVATGRRWIADSGTMLRLLQYAARRRRPPERSRRGSACRARPPKPRLWHSHAILRLPR